MDFNKIQPDLINYKMRVVQGEDARVKAAKKPGGFARFLSGMGKVLGAVAMPLSFIFPPAAIGAAGMYGVGTLGDQMQQRTAQKQYEKAMNENATTVSFPGLSLGGGASGVVPASAGMSRSDSQVMNVLYSRDQAMYEHAHSI